jgi:putative PEP-CTERM system histidine kinase
MHDLKNLITQQELVVANAQRFRHRPEFIDDAIETVRSSVERMKKVVDQLRSAGQSEPIRSRADVTRVLTDARAGFASREPVPRVLVPPSPAWVNMDRDKLESILTHLIRNAQDATPPDGSIDVLAERSGRYLEITVTDTGEGMDAGFIRDRLFRPFESTKGAKGMGIGAYQVRETVRSAGGDVDVQSEVGVGTKFQVRLPLAEEEDSALRQPAA